MMLRTALSTAALTLLLAVHTANAQIAKPNAQMQAVLDKLASMNGKPIETCTPEQARQQPTPGDAVGALIVEKTGKEPKPEEVGQVKNAWFTSGGKEIEARVYFPKGEAPSGGWPTIVYYHGGGWVIATIDTYDSSCRALCTAVNAVVVSCDYRKAPEHKFPAAVDDAVAGYMWARDQANEWHCDPFKMAIAGESAGGNLATVVCRRLRDNGDTMPMHQLLVYPVTNYGFDTVSEKENADAKPLNLAMMRWFWGHYLPSPAQGTNHDASPLRADLRGLPPATIITAEIDPLRTEGQDYGAQLRAASVDVRAKNFGGVTHEFFGMGAVVDTAKEAVQFAAEGLKVAFAVR